jgi:DNA-binding NtrC family response regulator
VDTAVEALRLGAYDYLTKPVDVPRLKSLLSGLKRSRAMRDVISSLRGELRSVGRFGSMIGTSPAMQKVYDLVSRVAPTNASVFLVGESGTGKELVASAVHQMSRRRGEKFVALNCGAITPTLLESELFGHEKGSFTGASRRHLGYFERAHGGTLFLDEITEMPLELQVKLLRVLETASLMRVGGDTQVPVDVRIIAATNREPEAAVEDGKLRIDLLYRLNVFPVVLPPLREREGDVELLVEEFLRRLNEGEEVRRRISPEALEELTRHDWPGNVRELKNVVERAFILSDEIIGRQALPSEITGEAKSEGPVLRVRVGSTVAEVERRLILATLDRCGGNKTEAAEILGLSVKTIYNRTKEYDAESARPTPEEL